MAELEQMPGLLDLKFKRGDDVNFQPVLTDEADAPLVLPTTGWRAQVRQDTGLASPVLFSIAVNAADAASGEIGLYVSGTDTAEIDGTFAWDLENTDEKRTYLSGKVRISGDVSRDV
ncbi:hypothetical protein [Microbacterium jejuense]|uniref:hypothetical protein n=1 Tax=Microbacterium jejuense TaxID=1263637 RepID=UPI0031EC490E